MFITILKADIEATRNAKKPNVANYVLSVSESEAKRLAAQMGYAMDDFVILEVPEK